MKLVLVITCTLIASFSEPVPVLGQDAAAAAKPTEHFVGTIAATDPAAQSITVKEDANGSEHLVQLQTTRTLLKVAPGAKDLKAATRISPSDLSVGDRVDVRGSAVESDPKAIAARSIVLMSSRDLQQAHQNEASEWKRSTGGTVSSIDPASKKITITVRSAEGPKPMVVDGAAATFTRYSPEHPKAAVPSQFGDIQAGDQVRVIGEKSSDGASISAQKIYSGTFRTLAGTVSSVAPDGTSLVVKDLTSKQSVTIALNADSGIHKLPPMMATMLARRFNPDFKSADGATSPGGQPGAAGTPPYGAKAGEAGSAGPGAGSGAGRPGMGDGSAHPQPAEGGAPAGGGAFGGAGARGGRFANGDLSQMLDRLPKIAPADLKPGDAVVVSGSPSAGAKSTLLATSVIAGVEPIFQAAPGRQAQSLGDWGSSLGGGAAMDAGAPPQ